MQKTATAFVLSLFDTGLAAVRSLGRHGIPVLGLDHNPSHAGFASRYARTLHCPDPTDHPEALLALLLREGRRLPEPGVLFPASDAFVLFVSRHRQALGEVFRMALPTEEVLEAIIDKRRQYELARAVGTPLPLTFTPHSLKDVDEIEARLAFPAIIKPCYGHLWRKTYSSTKGIKVQNAAELRARLLDILPSGHEVVVQSIILGPATNHYKLCAYLGEQGEPRGVFTLRKLRQCPVEFGVGSMVESCHAPEVAAEGLRFLQGIGYRGIGSVEFKRDDRDGRLKLIELNPRIWQQNILAADCGVNLPLLMYRDLTGQPVESPTRFELGRRWLDLESDLASATELLERGELSLPRLALQWGSAGSFSKFAWDDPGPALKASENGRRYLRVIQRLLGSAGHGLKSEPSLGCRPIS